MKIALISFILIGFIKSLHAADNLSEGTENLVKTLWPRWPLLEFDFNSHYSNERLAVLLSLNGSNVEVNKSLYAANGITTHILNLAKLGNPWSPESFKSVVESAEIMDAENALRWLADPLQLLSDFIPETQNSMPLQTALKRQIDSGVPAQEALTVEFKRYMKKKRAEAWNNKSLQEKNERITNYIANSNLDIETFEIERGPAGMERGLCHYVSTTDIEMVQVLLAIGADVDEVCDIFVGWLTPLYTASQNGHERVVKLLLEKGAEVNQAPPGKKSWSGVTPLMVASMQGHAEVVKVLLDNGADVNQADKDGWTPLYAACFRGWEGSDCSANGHEEVVQILLDAGADVNTADKQLRTPLFLASKKGHDKVVQLLLEKHANVNQAPKSGSFEGETPLYVASWNGHDEVVRLLIDASADVNLPNNEGKTPLYAASWNGHDEVIQLLRKHEAAVRIQAMYRGNQTRAA